MDLVTRIYNKEKLVGIIEIKNNKMIRNESYAEYIWQNHYAKVSDANIFLNMLSDRIICPSRWTKGMLESIGETEYNVYNIIRKTHGMDIDDYLWFEFDDQKLRYEDIKIRD